MTAPNDSDSDSDALGESERKAPRADKAIALARRKDRRRRSRRRLAVSARLATWFREIEDRAEKSNRKRLRAAVYTVRISVHVVQQWARDRCPQQAASLAFQTLISIVPAFTLMFAALRATGNLEAEGSLVGFLAERYIPVGRDVIAGKLQEFANNINFQSLGMVGLITTMILAFVLFNSLEKITNQIWRTENRRPLTHKFVVFYAFATIGPLLLGVSFYQAGKVGLTSGFSGAALSFVITFVALFLANFFLPSVKVRVGPALIGTAVTTFAFEVAKYGFDAYVSGFAFSKYAGIYGALAVLPLFLIWVYYSWLMLLLGTEIAHAAQNVHLLEGMERRGQLSFENEIMQRVNGPMAARLMVVVAEAYVSGDKIVTTAQLADRFDLSDDVVRRLVERLKDNDLVIEVEGSHSGLLPARPPADITLAEVLDTFRGSDRDQSSTRANHRLNEILTSIEQETERRTRNLSLQDLAAPAEDDEDDEDDED